MKKSPATGSIAQNGEFQNPKGRVLKSKFSAEGYFEKSILQAGRQKRFSTVSVISRHDGRDLRFLLRPDKRTLICCYLRSASGPIADVGLGLLDHLVGKHEKVVRDVDAEQLGGLEIDDQLEFGRLHDWQVGRLRPL